MKWAEQPSFGEEDSLYIVHISDLAVLGLFSFLPEVPPLWAGTSALSIQNGNGQQQRSKLGFLTWAVVGRNYRPTSGKFPVSVLHATGSRAVLPAYYR